MSAEDRAWEVVRRAFEEQLPAPRRRAPSNRLLFGLVALGAVVAAVASPPGRAVLGSLRDAVGVEHASPALFSLPAPGRLLVVSSDHGGVWVVDRDGSKRRLGDYDDARWSPHGLFVVATRRNELLAIEPDGTERWSLARADVHDPSWQGSTTDTRIAYVSRSGLRVVAGDGTGDRLMRANGDLPAWRPGTERVLASVAGGTVSTGAATAVLPGREPTTGLQWAADGSRLLATHAHGLTFVGPRGRLLRRVDAHGLVVAAAFAPRGHALAYVVRRARESEVRLLDGRRLFSGAGIIGDVAWSPDGRWLLVDWRTANQWLFVATTGRPVVRAVANISAQFPRADGASPSFRLRWCCAP